MRKFLCLVLAAIVVSNPAEEPRESSKTLELIDGVPSYYIKPPAVQAGHTPTLVGEVFLPRHQQYPGLLNMKDEASLQQALQLNSISGLSSHVSSFMIAGWDDIDGVPLAYVVDDLVEAGYSGEMHDARTGLLDIFRIELLTPEHDDTVFPQKLLLHTEYRKGDKTHTTVGDMVSDHRDGIYRISSVDLSLMELQEVYNEFGPRQGIMDDPTKMRLTKLTGFNPHTAIPNLPSVKGAMLIHHVYLGSYRITSGWQWIGRPEGLFESQQRGFVQ